jgi:hypothetical protein
MTTRRLRRKKSLRRKRGGTDVTFINFVHGDKKQSIAIKDTLSLSQVYEKISREFSIPVNDLTLTYNRTDIENTSKTTITQIIPKNSIKNKIFVSGTATPHRHKTRKHKHSEDKHSSESDFKTPLSQTYYTPLQSPPK